MSRAAAFLLVKIKDMNRVRGLLACAVLTLLFGCTTGLRDSVYLHDSVFVNQWTQGDTVFVDKVVTRYKYKDRLRHDTVAVVRADSVRVPYPVEKDLGWWEKTRLYSFPVLVAMVAVLAFVVVWLVKKLRKK